MSFSFQYYVGEIKILKTKDHAGRPIFNQFLPNGCHHQTHNKQLLDSRLADKWASNHILGRNHLKNLNSLVKPLYGFQLINDSYLIATLEDKTKLSVTLDNGKLIVDKEVKAL